MEGQETLVVINPVAGSVTDVQRYRTVIAERLAAVGWNCIFHETQPREDVAAVVRTACDRGARLVIAVGGDGTIGEIVNGLVGTTVPLGILPLGTGNLLARALGIPRKLEPALHMLVNAPGTVGLDTMHMCGRHYVLNIGTGISAASIRDTRTAEKRRFGMLAYAWRIVGHVFSFRSYRFDLELDGQLRTVRATEVLVSNGAILETLPAVLGPPHTFRDGRVEVYVVNGRSLLDYIELLFRRVARRPDRHEQLRHISVSHTVSISARSKSRLVQGDGDVAGRTPITITVVPAAVQVIAFTSAAAE
ncbi:MAG: diacylglycerol/lipid kinase family protein [Alkalispirochaeta sp.]